MYILYYQVYLGYSTFQTMTTLLICGLFFGSLKKVMSWDFVVLITAQHGHMPCGV